MEKKLSRIAWQAIDLFQRIERMKKKIPELEAELAQLVILIPEEDLGEYIDLTTKILQKEK